MRGDRKGTRNVWGSNPAFTEWAGAQTPSDFPGTHCLRFSVFWSDAGPSLSYPNPWGCNSSSTHHTMAPQAHTSTTRWFPKALPHPSMQPSFPYHLFPKKDKLQKRRSSYIKGHVPAAVLPTPFSCCQHGLNTNVRSISAVDDTTSCQWFRMKDSIKQWLGTIFLSN